MRFNNEEDAWMVFARWLTKKEKTEVIHKISLHDNQVSQDKHFPNGKQVYRVPVTRCYKKFFVFTTVRKKKQLNCLRQSETVRCECGKNNWQIICNNKTYFRRSTFWNTIHSEKVIVTRLLPQPRFSRLTFFLTFDTIQNTNRNYFDLHSLT